jgi:hypothetical protein
MLNVTEICSNIFLQSCITYIHTHRQTYITVTEIKAMTDSRLSEVTEKVRYRIFSACRTHSIFSDKFLHEKSVSYMPKNTVISQPMKTKYILPGHRTM